MIKAEFKMKKESSIERNIWDDLHNQTNEMMNYLCFPPFTIKKNFTKANEIKKQIDKITNTTLRNIALEKDINKKIFNSIIADNKEMFTEANRWIKRSSNDYVAAAELYRATNDPTEIGPPIGGTAGWIP